MNIFALLELIFFIVATFTIVSVLFVVFGFIYYNLIKK